MNELFPLRIATGKRFCNREKERQLLKEYIEEKRPTVLISPRRYGKTSLSNKVVEELKYPFCSVDLLTAYDDDAICTSIIKSVSELISQIMPINMKTIALVEKSFRGIRAAIRSRFIELEYASPIERSDPARQVLEVLSGLEKLATKLDKTVVVFIDEFQRALDTPQGTAIQGSIRHVAQSAKHVAFLFSGSSRHMLSQAFDDPNCPLYMMCEKLFLERIAPEDYEKYIQDAAKIKWSHKLDNHIINRILELAEVHPFYVNYLCSKLWQQTKRPTDEEEVDEAWHQCALDEERRFIAELDKLTLTQRIILKAIANTVNLTEPTGTRFLNQVKLASGTITPALKALRKKDMIYVDKAGVTKVLDPLIAYTLTNEPLTALT